VTAKATRRLARFPSLFLLVATLVLSLIVIKLNTNLSSKATRPSNPPNWGFAAKLDNGVQNIPISESPIYIQFQSDNFNPQLGYTAEIMFKPSAAAFPSKFLFSYLSGGSDQPSLQLLVSSYSDNTSGYGMTLQSFINERTETGTCQQNSIVIFTPSLTSEQITSWHHAAIAIQNDGQYTLFLDGKRSPQVLTLAGICPSSDPFVVGVGNGLVASFAGTLDEVRISNVARYTPDFPGITAPFGLDINTLALYHFDKDYKDFAGKSGAGTPIGKIDFVRSRIK